jgi:hypothetical protein
MSETSAVTLGPAESRRTADRWRRLLQRLHDDEVVELMS